MNKNKIKIMSVQDIKLNKNYETFLFMMVTNIFVLSILTHEKLMLLEFKQLKGKYPLTSIRANLNRPHYSNEELIPFASLIWRENNMSTFFLLGCSKVWNIN